mmetsp:Transcript_15603/g.41898  ORF Transcript_15603/g.41898 Transcript_15603/m.41898 type:complete len:329 (-) Transcript_15603:1044-2030(-)
MSPHSRARLKRRPRSSACQRLGSSCSTSSRGSTRPRRSSSWDSTTRAIWVSRGTWPRGSRRCTSPRHECVHSSQCSVRTRPLGALPRRWRRFRRTCRRGRRCSGPSPRRVTSVKIPRTSAAAAVGPARSTDAAPATLTLQQTRGGRVWRRPRDLCQERRALRAPAPGPVRAPRGRAQVALARQSRRAVATLCLPTVPGQVVRLRHRPAPGLGPVRTRRLEGALSSPRAPSQPGPRSRAGRPGPLRARRPRRLPSPPRQCPGWPSRPRRQPLRPGRRRPRRRVSVNGSRCWRSRPRRSTCSRPWPRRPPCDLTAPWWWRRWTTPSAPSP